MFTSVAYAVGPRVNKILYFSHFQNWKFLNLAMWTHSELNWFLLPTQFLQFEWIYNKKNSFKNQYLSQFNFENCEMNLIQSDLPSAFQQHQECPQYIPIHFSFSILFTFHWGDGSIINSFHGIVSPKERGILLQCAHSHCWTYID
jgi:hypothetical protein